MKKFELKWKLYNYISIRKLVPIMDYNKFDNMSY